MDETPTTPGPRRYSVKMDVTHKSVGPLFSLLIEEVERPHLEEGVDGFLRISIVCTKDQLPTVVGLINDHAAQLYIGPYNPEAKSQPAVYRPPQQMARVVTPLQRDTEVMRPARTRQPDGQARTVNTASAKAMLTAFNDGGRVKHPADFVEALVAHNFSASGYSAIAARLVQEGDLVRIGQGAYRLPTGSGTPVSPSRGSTNSA